MRILLQDLKVIQLYMQLSKFINKIIPKISRTNIPITIRAIPKPFIFILNNYYKTNLSQCLNSSLSVPRCQFFYIFSGHDLSITFVPIMQFNYIFHVDNEFKRGCLLYKYSHLQLLIQDYQIYQKHILILVYKISLRIYSILQIELYLYLYLILKFNLRIRY